MRYHVRSRQNQLEIVGVLDEQNDEYETVMCAIDELADEEDAHEMIEAHVPEALQKHFFVDNIVGVVWLVIGIIAINVNVSSVPIRILLNSRV